MKILLTICATLFVIGLTPVYAQESINSSPTAPQEATADGGEGDSSGGVSAPTEEESQTTTTAQRPVDPPPASPRVKRTYSKLFRQLQGLGYRRLGRHLVKKGFKTQSGRVRPASNTELRKKIAVYRKWITRTSRLHQKYKKLYRKLYKYRYGKVHTRNLIRQGVFTRQGKRRAATPREVRRGVGILRKRIRLAKRNYFPRPPGWAMAKLRRIAQCESHGNYRTNTGNGYYGAYQFSWSTWRSVGGRGNPAYASRYEQDYRAWRLMRQAGTSPWPVCGSR